MKHLKFFTKIQEIKICIPDLYVLKLKLKLITKPKMMAMKNTGDSI